MEWRKGRDGEDRKGRGNGDSHEEGELACGKPPCKVTRPGFDIVGMPLVVAW